MAMLVVPVMSHHLHLAPVESQLPASQSIASTQYFTGLISFLLLSNCIKTVKAKSVVLMFM